MQNITKSNFLHVICNLMSRKIKARKIQLNTYTDDHIRCIVPAYVYSYESVSRRTVISALMCICSETTPCSPLHFQLILQRLRCENSISAFTNLCFPVVSYYPTLLPAAEEELILIRHYGSGCVRQEEGWRH